MKEYPEYFEKVVIGIRDVRGNGGVKARIDAEAQKKRIEEAYAQGYDALQTGAIIGYELDDESQADLIRLIDN